MSTATMRIKQPAQSSLAGMRRVVIWITIVAVFLVSFGSVVSTAPAFSAASAGMVAVIASAPSGDDGDFDSKLGSGCVLRHTGACMQLQAPSPEIVRVAPCAALCEAVIWPISDALVASGVVAPPSEPPRI